MPSPHGSRVPSWIPVFNPVARLFLRIGVPMGDNALLTIRGRKTGVPRTTSLAIAEIAGTHWVLSPFGETDWARNLRAARSATVTAGQRTGEVVARELTDDERVAFYRDVLNPFARRSRLVSWIVRHVDGLDINDPQQEAARGPVFEIRWRDRA